MTEAGGSGFRPGQWYLHLFDTSQPDWNWHHPDVPALFEDVIRFWLDRGVAGLRVDVAHGIFKDPGLPGWRAAGFRGGIDAALAVTGGSRAPWVTGNHDVPRPASRYRLDEGFTPEMTARLIALGDRNAEAGARRARAAALVLLALPGSAYLYQGEELGLPEVTGIPDDARQDPRFFRTKGEYPGRDGCRVPLPWAPAGPGFGFSRTRAGAPPSAPWLPRPPDWGSYSVASQLADERSFLHLYRAALRLRRDHPALGRGTLRWLSPENSGLLCFARDPAFILAVNFGPEPAPPPAARSSWPAIPSPAAPPCRPIPPPGCRPDPVRTFSSYPANGTTLWVMPKVRVPRKNVTTDEVVTVLSRRLGPGYQVESNGSRRIIARKNAVMYATISIRDQPGASVFGVHGGGLPPLRLVNTFSTARQVADALRRSPEFRSL